MSVATRMPLRHVSGNAISNIIVNKPLSLIRNFSWTLIGTGLYAFCQWGMLVVLAKRSSAAPSWSVNSR